MAHAGIRTLLYKAGYEANSSIEAQLGELSRRIENNGSFPHEIGLFIGYPAKDVAAFMGLIKLPFACQCLWKNYGKPAQSLLDSPNNIATVVKEWAQSWQQASRLHSIWTKQVILFFAIALKTIFSITARNLASIKQQNHQT